jgi:hypothetical protein
VKKRLGFQRRRVTKHREESIIGQNKEWGEETMRISAVEYNKQTRTQVSFLFL